EQIAAIEAFAGQALQEVRNVTAQFDNRRPFAEQTTALADACHLSPQEWQTLPLLILPPALNFIAVALLAELHGRMGYFPSAVRTRPVEGSLPPRFEAAEIIPLQAIREAARLQR
ncbi:MAG: CRISPR-associated protein Csx15, partial [Chloroflexi bacterium]|nr:CRISPR-associated protein Csx15 [Chloroflexota bacterium]